MHRALAHRMYYGWVVVGITILTLLISSGVRSAPGVLIHPLEEDLGWTRTQLSFAVSIGLILTGLAAPLGGALMDRIGPRRVMLGGLILIVGSLAGGAAMNALWQLTLFWGVISGVGTGVVATVLGATVATRWFVARRGMVLGGMSAAASAGQLVFVPLLMWLVVVIGWRSATLVLMGCALALILPVLVLMRDAPGDIGLLPYGAAEIVETDVARIDIRATLRHATRVPEFWLLAGSFFICGATSNGLVGTHLIPHAIDHGIPEVTAAGVLAVMGAMNFTGTLASGWLTDRYDPRKLLACYYTFRGVSLFLVPFVTDVPGLTVFAVLFGLDYIATVPPTV
ncbi:MAG: MFS transporter, partial [Thermomicrobiales bacterium]